MIRFSLFLLFTLFSIVCQANKINILITKPDSSPAVNLVVYLTPSQPLTSNKIIAPLLIVKQKNKKFTPYIEVLQQGQQIHFQNDDDITHHIYSVSGKNRFSFKLKGHHSQNSPSLAHLGEVAMGCNIHDWMSGYVYVVNTPYFTKSNEDGLAHFNDLPAGKYQLTIWHPQLDVAENKIEQTIEVGKKTQWQVTLPKKLLVIPNQENQEEFDFLEEY